MSNQKCILGFSLLFLVCCFTACNLVPEAKGSEKTPEQDPNLCTLHYVSTGHVVGTVPADQAVTMNAHTVVTNGSLKGPVIVAGKVWQKLTGWNTQSDGLGITYQTGDSITLTEDLTLYAQYSTGTDVLRKAGPAGGWIFYDAGSTQAWGRYLEAWTADEPGTYQWKTTGDVTLGTAKTIGSGKANTYNVLLGNGHPAAEVARNAIHGGFDDWFLPSEEEAIQMIWVLHSRRAVAGMSSTVTDNPAYGTNRVGGFVDTPWQDAFCWTSSDWQVGYALMQYYGGQTLTSFGGKLSKVRVRVIRAF